MNTNEHRLFPSIQPVVAILPSPSVSKREARIVEIPVLSYVAKVMRRLYGDGVIHACNNTLLGKAIYTQFMEIPEELGFPERPLPSDKIKIELNYRLARYYTQWGLHKVAEHGIFYEKVVQRMMLQHIIACVRCGKTIEFAIEDFFKLYGIHEDDYARETAKMLYHTHRKNLNL